MKKLAKLLPLLVYALIFSISIAIAQAPIPVVKKRAYLFEYGHFENDRQDMILDTLVNTTVEVEIYEDAVLIHSEAKQDYSLGYTLKKESDDKYYYLSIEAVDQDGDFCNVIINYDKYYNQYKVTIAYNNIYIRYYM